MEVKKVAVAKRNYGQTPNGETVALYSLKNTNGMQVDFLTYGGIITTLKVPNREGYYENVVLGFNSLTQYVERNPFFGVIVGRFGNRIAKGKFSLDGTEYSLAINNGKNHLHGGLKGFDKVLWTVKEVLQDASKATVTLAYLSPDMEEGYPGNLAVEVSYSLNTNNVFSVHYGATTDKATIVNLTQHSYFNLSGDFTKAIVDHEVEIKANHYLPVDDGLIPLGELAAVAHTPFDFRIPKPIGSAIDADHIQLKIAGGYDHCWALNGAETGLKHALSAYHPKSGRHMEVFTEEPGLQFYTGNFLDGTIPAPNGGFYTGRSGFCVETQHFPDAPNQKDFPSVVLRPGEQYSTTTQFKFSVK
ncbi:aldose epimerase family protein [Arenibacter sp. GZD96]|uniref:aldose epimerase family protein n=1 Tax=Aurantibrevibacter litoralis TaxID=3106030 RepID=UPI002AFE6D22|nr:aldose epimerase family protein [Arenibacter sp. GZD-96]MEA1785512.1 aldose epimerase family protein [Arenibacter sp. GZD-96]